MEIVHGMTAQSEGWGVEFGYANVSYSISYVGQKPSEYGHFLWPRQCPY